jgi:hypothetical protein
LGRSERVGKSLRDRGGVGINEKGVGKSLRDKERVGTNEEGEGGLNLCTSRLQRLRREWEGVVEMERV